MNIYENKLLKRISRKIFSINPNVSYSQNGEDIIINFLIEAKKIKNFNWLDIGANHPTKFSNTYLFYNKNFHGISVEPNPSLVSLHKKLRSKDKVIQAGIGTSSDITKGTYYIMEHHELNTFSKEEASKMEKEGFSKIISTMQVDLIPLNSFLSDNFKDKSLSFLNLDVEGLDMDILRKWDFSICSPKIICVETVSFSNDASSKKNIDIISHLQSKGYTIFADTYINTIFYKEN